MANEPITTITGNLTRDPEIRYTPSPVGSRIPKGCLRGAQGPRPVVAEWRRLGSGTGWLSCGLDFRVRVPSRVGRTSGASPHARSARRLAAARRCLTAST
jgi:hypothetical protein